MKYTGINRLLKSGSLQKYLDKLSDRTYRDFLSDWKWILSYTKKRKWRVLLFTLLGLLSSTLGVASAYITGLLINVISEKQTAELPLYIGLTVGVTFFAIFSNAIKSRVSKKIELDLIKDIQTDLFCNIIDLRWTELKKYKNGDLLNRFNKDMETVMDNAITWIPSILVNLYTFTITLILLFRMDPIMAYICLGSAPFVFLLSHYILRRQKEYRNKVLQLDSDMMSFEAESFYNMDTVKAFGVWDILSERLTDLQKKYRLYNMDYNLFQIKSNVLLSLISHVVALGALGYCLFRLWTGDILFGDMTFFLTQRSAISSLFTSIVATIPTMLNASISAHRIREFINLDKEDHNPEAYQTVKSVSDKGLSMCMKHLSFSYSDGQKVYENADFTVHSGEMIALLGESGGGKTTLFRLLLGLVLPDEGQIIIKDAEGHEVGMNADLRKFISYVPQGNTMMMGTIAENMRLVKKEATDAELIGALKTACAWEFVEPIGGIYAMLGERGKGISEGQAQRISIARAVLRDAPILFLDEATSALDSATEETVLENVAKASPDKAIVISTHRLSVLKKCKRVYRITDKKIELSDRQPGQNR